MAGALFFILTDRACSVPSQCQEWFLFDFYYKVLFMGQKIGGKENERKCSNSGTAKCTG